MKHLFTFFIAIGFYSQVSAQKVEVLVGANGGLFHYTGANAVSQSQINFGSGYSYTNNIYGNRNAFSYGGMVQFKMVSKVGIIAGLQTGYDMLRSKVNIAQQGVEYSWPIIYAGQASQNMVNGYSILSSSFINISPFVGYRLIDNDYTLDIMPGIDIGLGLGSREKGKVTSPTTDTEYTTDIDRGKPKTDLRLRLGAEAGYKKWTLAVSYASGKSNYMRGYVGGSPEAYSSLLRFGVGYRIF